MANRLRDDAGGFVSVHSAEKAAARSGCSAYDDVGPPHLDPLRRAAQRLRQPHTAASPRGSRADRVRSLPGFFPVAEDVLFRALGLVGTPYRWGGNTPDSGFDCSGLIGFVYRDAAGISLPRSTREMIVMQAPNVGKEGLQTGDLIFFATNGGSQVSHAGIYVGKGASCMPRPRAARSSSIACRRPIGRRRI